MNFLGVKCCGIIDIYPALGIYLHCRLRQDGFPEHWFSMFSCMHKCCDAFYNGELLGQGLKR